MSARVSSNFQGDLHTALELQQSEGVRRYTTKNSGTARDPDVMGHPIVSIFLLLALDRFPGSDIGFKLFMSRMDVSEVARHLFERVSLVSEW